MRLYKRTISGRVVYDRKKHVFNGVDMARIVIKVNNNRTGDFPAWNAVATIANRQVAEQLEQTPVTFEILEEAFQKEAREAYDALMLLLSFIGRHFSEIVIRNVVVPLFEAFLEFIRRRIR